MDYERRGKSQEAQKQGRIEDMRELKAANGPGLTNTRNVISFKRLGRKTVELKHISRVST